MIPEKWYVPIACDCCGETKNILLESERIDSDGLELCIEEALRDWGWDSCGRNTFCPKCIDRALTMALQELARDADKKKEVRT